MIETHPFGDFVPPKAKYLLLGSFTGRQTYDWYYGTQRNQFWRILELAYGRKLENKAAKQRLFMDLQMAIGDIIYQCERAKGSNLDANLINIVYNTHGIEKILSENKIETIFFTSRFVEVKFRRLFKHLLKTFPDLKLVTLPSPSPRFAKFSKEDKAKKYKLLLPSV